MTEKKITLADLVDCFHVPSETGIIDMVHPITGRGAYGNKTLEEIRKEHPGAVKGDYDTVNVAKDDMLIQPPASITKERFWEMLEVLPPEDWRHHGGGESFKMMERYSGQITSIFVRIGEDYYELRNRVTLPHLEILALCAEAA